MVRRSLDLFASRHPRGTDPDPYLHPLARLTFTSYGTGLPMTRMRVSTNKVQ